MSTRKAATAAEAPAELEPVELDPPDPTLVRWREFADRVVDIVHDGDASKVINTPRPAWSDPDEDVVDVVLGGSIYMSKPAKVALRLERGVEADDGDTLKPARMAVRAFAGRMCDKDLPGIEVKFVRAIKGKTDDDHKPWMHTRTILMVSEARELVDVLLAAIELVGGTPPDAGEETPYGVKQ